MLWIDFMSKIKTIGFKGLFNWLLKFFIFNCSFFLFACTWTWWKRRLIHCHGQPGHYEAHNTKKHCKNILYRISSFSHVKKKLLSRQGHWNIFDCFLKVGRTALRIGIFDGSSLTIMGEMTDPIIPPNAPETRVATGFLSINEST